MLQSGTTSLSKKDINDKLDKYQSEISVSGSAGSVNIFIYTDKKNLDSTLAILKEIILHPSFDQNEFEKMVAEMKGELEANRSDPQYIAANTYSKKVSLYPKEHPFYPRSIDETLNELKSITVDNLKDFYTQFYGSNHAIVTVVGDLEAESFKNYLQNSFGTFNSPVSYAEVTPKYFDVAGSTENILTPDKKNATCRAGINLQVKETDADYPALLIANELLGGGAFLSSRIPQRLREHEGMSYGAGSYLSINYKYAASSWGLYAIFNPMFKNRLDSAMHDEINKALKDGFTEDEMKKSIESWLQQNKTYLGMDRYLTQVMNSYLQDDRDLNTYTDLENKVKVLTVGQINDALRKYMKPDKLVFIYAGDFK
jgi:zinc protease